MYALNLRCTVDWGDFGTFSAYLGCWEFFAHFFWLFGCTPCTLDPSSLTMKNIGWKNLQKPSLPVSIVPEIDQTGYGVTSAPLRECYVHHRRKHDYNGGTNWFWWNFVKKWKIWNSVKRNTNLGPFSTSLSLIFLVFCTLHKSIFERSCLKEQV